MYGNMHVKLSVVVINSSINIHISAHCAFEENFFFIFENIFAYFINSKKKAIKLCLLFE
jgi:hypothetical protein